MCGSSYGGRWAHPEKWRNPAGRYADLLKGCDYRRRCAGYRKCHHDQRRAELNGEIDGSIFITSGKITLGEAALVHGDIGGTSGKFHRESGAVVEGQVNSRGSELSGGENILPRLIGKVVAIPLGILVVVIFLISSLRSRTRDATQEAISSSTDPAQKLKKLQELKESNLTTEAEFQAKKAEILAEF